MDQEWDGNDGAEPWSKGKVWNPPQLGFSQGWEENRELLKDQVPFPKQELVVENKLSPRNHLQNTFPEGSHSRTPNSLCSGPQGQL